MKLFQSLMLLLLMAFGVACNSNTSTDEQDTDAAATDELIVPQSRAVMTDFPVTTQYNDAAITGYTYENGRFHFDVDGNTYSLGAQTPDANSVMCANSDQGQHIHLIINNEPYSAHYKSDFDYKLEDGTYHMLAFLSRSYHESIKTSGAYVADRITVKNGSITNKESITEPMLFYSRPKGKYVGKDTRKVMLDYYMVNADMKDGFKVLADVNGQSFGLNAWLPKYVENLPMGDNNITLTLVDANKNIVDNPLNPVSRNFTLIADPLEE